MPGTDPSSPGSASRATNLQTYQPASRLAKAEAGTTLRLTEPRAELSQTQPGTQRVWLGGSGGQCASAAATERGGERSASEQRRGAGPE
eukprot:364968-Rhodomonas_salina.1